MYLRIILLILFFPAICSAVDEYELPFGFYALIDDSDSNVVDSVANLLGANVVISGKDIADNYRRFAVEGIKALASLLWPIQTRDYIEACYSIWQAENDDFEIKFDRQYGFGYQGSGADSIYWIIPPDGQNPEDTALDDLWYRQPRKELWSDLVIDYTPKIKLWVDTANADSGDTVGYLKVYSDQDSWGSYSGRHLHLQISCPIVADSFFTENPKELKYNIYNIYDGGSVVTYQVTTTNVCTLKVDYVKVHNYRGFNLIENGTYNNNIRTWVTQSWCHPDTIYGWEMRDEPMPDMYMPYRYVDSLIRDTTYHAFGDSLYGISVFSWGTCNDRAVDFLEIAKPIKWTIDRYPFKGACSKETKYSGYFNNQSNQGLQYALGDILAERADTTKKISDNYGIDWWFVPQLFCGRGKVCNGVTWRWPTPSELTCETFIGMCYKPNGIVYYKHGSSWRYDSTEVGYIGFAGLYDTTTTPDLKIDLFNKIKDDINPYIKAIDSTYLGLTWDDAYYIKPDSAMPGGWIDTIYALSNSPDSNPDLGWFHVGQFTDTSSAKYVMIVNRACSQGPDNPDPAPSITATVKFEPEYLQFGNYVEIIDIADSIDYISYDSILVFAETTYVSVQNGLLTYTTDFGPGEGRLFKIVQSR